MPPSAALRSSPLIESSILLMRMLVVGITLLTLAQSPSFSRSTFAKIKAWAFATSSKISPFQVFPASATPIASKLTTELVLFIIFNYVERSPVAPIMTVVRLCLLNRDSTFLTGAAASSETGEGTLLWRGFLLTTELQVSVSGGGYFA